MGTEYTAEIGSGNSAELTGAGASCAEGCVIRSGVVSGAHPEGPNPGATEPVAALAPSPVFEEQQVQVEGPSRAVNSPGSGEQTLVWPQMEPVTQGTLCSCLLALSQAPSLEGRMSLPLWVGPALGSTQIGGKGPPNPWSCLTGPFYPWDGRRRGLPAASWRYPHTPAASPGPRPLGTIARWPGRVAGGAGSDPPSCCLRGALGPVGHQAQTQPLQCGSLSRAGGKHGQRGEKVVSR